jgi:hypothetical protein
MLELDEDHKAKVEAALEADREGRHQRNAEHYARSSRNLNKKRQRRYDADPEKYRGHQKKYRASHLEASRASSAAWFGNNPDVVKYVRVHAAKYRAKNKELDFNLTVESIDWPTHCPVFGFEFDYSKRRNPAGKTTSPSLDRIDNSKGYTLDNVQVISNLANTMKLNATPEQLTMFANWILESQKNSGKP